MSSWKALNTVVAIIFSVFPTAILSQTVTETAVILQLPLPNQHRTHAHMVCKWGVCGHVQKVETRTCKWVVRRTMRYPDTDYFENIATQCLSEARDRASSTEEATRTLRSCVERHDTQTEVDISVSDREECTCWTNHC